MSELKFKRNIVFWKDSLREAATAPNAMEMLLQQLRYALLTGDMPFDKLSAIVLEEMPEAKEAIMTTAEQLRQEGRQEGHQEGRQEGLIALLEYRFGPLPDEHLARIKAATKEQLDRYAEQAKEVEILSAMFADS
jgi:predicted transposase YdaD